MKRSTLLLFFVLIFSILIMAFHKLNHFTADVLTGAWEKVSGTEWQVLLFTDGYFTHTVFDKEGRRFHNTSGGAYTVENGKISIRYEFDTKEKSRIGETVTFSFEAKQNSITTTLDGKQETWLRVDAANEGLAGLWKITARKQEGGLVPIHQTGTRKTVKILTATRFQWAAIDPGTKQFMGTGGGTYTFRDGKYTEHIEFFSRDSSRVGSSLSFDGKLENGDWHHSGLSSRGEPIYEIWSRRK